MGRSDLIGRSANIIIHKMHTDNSIKQCDLENYVVSLLYGTPS